MVLKYDKITAVFREQDIHEQVSKNKFVIKLECTFQDSENLYFLM